MSYSHIHIYNTRVCKFTVLMSVLISLIYMNAVDCQEIYD